MRFIGTQITEDALRQFDRARELDRRGPRAAAIRYAIERYVEQVAINGERPAEDGAPSNPLQKEGSLAGS